MMWRVIEPLTLTLVSPTSVSTAAYIVIMFDGSLDAVSVTEGLNYSVQTITTVGYGNWIPANVSVDDPRVLMVKRLSIPFMLAGGALFTVIVGVVANLMSRL